MGGNLPYCYFYRPFSYPNIVLERPQYIAVDGLFGHSAVVRFGCYCCFTRSAYDVHETEDIYTATQVNLAKRTKEQSATYQMRFWSQRQKGQQSTGHIMVTSCCVHHHHGSESREKISSSVLLTQLQVDRYCI